MQLKPRFLASIGDIRPAAWDALFDGNNPFLRHAYLEALEASGSAAADTGWQPQHLVLERNGSPVAAMPLYLKTHSWGEFVFDWSWAQAYEQNGLDYYPKLVTAVPFTPSRGPRLGMAAGEDGAAVADELLMAIRQRVASLNLSGWHLLFPDRPARELLGASDALLERQDVQFHWRNRGYRDFDEFLAGLKSSRRKTLRRERREVAAADLHLDCRDGPDLTDADWDAFYRCYIATFFKRSGHSGYLNREFFERLRGPLAGQIMMVLARRGSGVVAGALFLHDECTLYGRYWGALEDVPFLHFEVCFYRGIDYCIERGLQRFDPGAQGEHKLLRGFEPVRTHSMHWIADARFRAAISNFLDRERVVTRDYGERAESLLPFRSIEGADD